MRRWLVDRVLILYPHAIRDRYGEEIRELLTDSPTPVRDLADVAWCALIDRITRARESMSLARARTSARTLGKLLLVPPICTVALVTLMMAVGPVLNMMVALGVDTARAAPVVHSSAVVPVGLLAWWLGRRVGRNGAVSAAWLAAPATLTVGLLLITGLPGAGIVLGEDRNSSILAVLCWCAGVAALGPLLRVLAGRGRTATALLTATAGGLALLTLTTITYVVSAVEPIRAPRQYALYWYLSSLSGVDPGLVDNGYLQLADAVKFLPALLTVCTVYVFALVTAAARSRSRDRQLLR
ncbi:hypothetical protein GCM10027290_03230 [Micromonospora sonneratiae]|uniref:ABC-2 type transport system permease protein n=1 Tax=Micromonospora sonneratiae TaxID=1184706 RepID=A0ABW3Y540_9ACTN